MRANLGVEIKGGGGVDWGGHKVEKEVLYCIHFYFSILFCCSYNENYKYKLHLLINIDSTIGDSRILGKEKH